MSPTEGPAFAPRPADMAASPLPKARHLRALPSPDELSARDEYECGHDEPADDEDVDWEALTNGERESLRAELQARLAAYVSRGRARVVLTDNTHTMMSVKRGQGVTSFRLHHMFTDAPSAVLRAVVRYAERQDAEASALLKHFIDANEVKIRAPTGSRPVALDVEGKHHNLQSLYDDLNERYFDGKIRARITWGHRGKRRRRRGSIRLGSYTVEDELIRIHPVLDASDVPEWFVAWIVYHEMLHEIHDMPIVDGRRIYHTREFREAEAQFEHYAACVSWERTHLDKLLTR